MQKYFTGFFTAVCLTSSIFIFMGSQNRSLGHIKAETIVVTNELGQTLINGDGMTLVNQYGKIVFASGIATDDSGYLQTFSKDGQEMCAINEGVLKTYNKDGANTGYFGTNKDDDGVAILFNKNIIIPSFADWIDITLFC